MTLLFFSSAMRADTSETDREEDQPNKYFIAITKDVSSE